MKRRDFLHNIAVTGAVAGTLGIPVDVLASSSAATKAQNDEPFRLKYAPHFGMFKHSAGSDLIDQIKFMNERGFRAIEDNGMKQRTIDMQTKISRTLEKMGMDMGVFVAHTIGWNDANLTSGNKEKRDTFLSEIRESVEVAKRVNAKWMTVVPGMLDFRQREGYQTANVIETLRRACDILEPHGLVMVLEVLNYRNHPKLFFRTISQGYEICRAIDSPSCKILDDLYHAQIEEGNLIPNMEKAWSEIGYIQLGDNPGRKEPTTGEINYKNVFKFIHEKGFKGILGMEHGNSKAGKDGEEAVIRAYRECDSFEV